MEEISLLREILSGGADTATMAICYLLYKMHMRVHNLEIKTGLRKLSIKGGE